MKPIPFNKRYGLNQAQRKPVAHPEDIEANYTYVEPQDSNVQQETLNFYFNVLKRRKWCLILTTCFIIPIVALSLISEEKIYSTSARLLIEDDNPQILNIKEITAPDKSITFFQTEYQLIQTQENIEEVIDLLQLDQETPPKKTYFDSKNESSISSSPQYFKFPKEYHAQHCDPKKRRR
jgi:uncharacterized protein involved in exopolysaccharide biosynthesis